MYVTKITSDLDTAAQVVCFQRRKVDGHHTAIGDAHSAGYEVILMVSFVICHDNQAGGGGQKFPCVSKIRKWRKKKEYDKPGGVTADKQVTTAAVA